MTQPNEHNDRNEHEQEQSESSNSEQRDRNDRNERNERNDDSERDWRAELASATRALDAERRGRSKLENQISSLKASQMSENEKALAAAKAEGHAEAMKAAGARLAAAEFRAQGAGKVPGLMALLDVMDLSRFVTDDGEPDVPAISAMIDKISEEANAKGNGHSQRKLDLPVGPQNDPGDGQDWLRNALRR